MQLDDKGRADVLFALGHLSSEEGSWRGFVKPFIENAWPRQLQYRSEVTSRAFVQLLDSMKGDFDDAVKTVLPFLRPVPHLNMITHRLTRETGDSQEVVRRFPAATLSLLDVLVADDRSTMPYDLGNVLEMISEAAPPLRSSPTWRRLKDLAG